jgi:hypothetical protein
MTLLPPKLALKPMFKVNVMVVPLPVTEEPVPFTVHWLFDALPVPGNSTLPANGPPASPASSTR